MALRRAPRAPREASSHASLDAQDCRCHVRVLTYVNPFLVDVAERGPGYPNHFAEAAARGFLVRSDEVSWDHHDGIKTAVTGMLSSGISGFAFQHSDAGGYTTLSHPLLAHHRSRELLLRWAELGAWNVVFRTREGNRPAVMFRSGSAAGAEIRACLRDHGLL
jgi:hypothetical protein